MNKCIYRNALGDLLYSDKKHEEEVARMEYLNKVAGQTTGTNPLVYIIPIAGILVIGVIAAIIIKRKKK